MDSLGLQWTFLVSSWERFHLRIFNCLHVLAKTNSFDANKEERGKKLIAFMLTQKRKTMTHFPWPFS